MGLISRVSSRTYRVNERYLMPPYMDDSMIMPPTPEKDEVPDVKVEHSSEEALKKKSRKLKDRFENKIERKLDTDDQPCFGGAVSEKTPNAHKNSKVITLNEITEFRGI